MYLKKLVIKNFRSFDDDGITLVFNKGINAIIGENNVGCINHGGYNIF